jgi:hypothetical protein
MSNKNMAAGCSLYLAFDLIRVSNVVYELGKGNALMEMTNIPTYKTRLYETFQCLGNYKHGDGRNILSYVGKIVSRVRVTRRGFGLDIGFIIIIYLTAIGL